MATRDIAAEGGVHVRNALLGIPAAYRSAVALARRKPLGAAGAVIALILILMAVGSRLAILPVADPYDSVGGIFLGPSREFPMGTDVIGRDMLSRVLYGTWISLYVGLGSVLIGITAGFMLGIVSTYAGGFVDLFFQRVVDALMSMPGLILALAIMAILGSSLNNVILAIVIGMIAPVVRTVRSQVLTLKEMDYVTAARAIGARPGRIVFKHIMPNCMAIYIIMATYYLGFAIIIEASLSFLGVGAPPDDPSWGGILTVASRESPETGIWLLVFPGIFIFIAVLAFNVLGDALRDVLDPRLRGR
jgi:ABC-type dipeptide/oligopeptide/nickel transport system permease subunit